jgi:exodeoxyribonuclease-3
MSTHSFRLATWNINSVRLRMPLLARLAEEFSPDVICLQETKVEDSKFPMGDVQRLGYMHVAFSGEKSYNGVAILSRLPLQDVAAIDFADLGHCRHIAATLANGVRVNSLYIPAGGDIPDRTQNIKFGQKLDFLDDLTRWSEGLPQEAPMILAGDFNIAPLEHDVWSHKALLDVVSHTPMEVERLSRLQAAGNWRDAVRHFVPEHEKSYSWWSYRARDWDAADKGRKLDHVWLSPGAFPALRAAHMPRAVRGWPQPSDHVPVLVDVAL